MFIVEVSSEPNGVLSRSWHDKAYKSFEKVMDVKKLEAMLKKESQYKIVKSSGKLLEVISTNEEIADKERLYTKMQYKMMADNKDPDATKQSAEATKEHDKTKRDGKISFLIDDM